MRESFARKGACACRGTVSYAHLGRRGRHEIIRAAVSQLRHITGDLQRAVARRAGDVRLVRHAHGASRLQHARQLSARHRLANSRGRLAPLSPPLAAGISSGRKVMLRACGAGGAAGTRGSGRYVAPETSASKPYTSLSDDGTGSSAAAL